MEAFPYSGFDNGMFSIIPVLFIIVFVLIIGMIIYQAVRKTAQWKSNNDSPVLTVEACVVTKREDVHHYHHMAGMDNMHHMSSSSTTYYVTFQVSSGDRLEFEVRDTEYGMLAENDKGKLTFQGSRYLGFVRNKQADI